MNYQATKLALAFSVLTTAIQAQEAVNDNGNVKIWLSDAVKNCIEQALKDEVSNSPVAHIPTIAPDVALEYLTVAGPNEAGQAGVYVEAINGQLARIFYTQTGFVTSDSIDIENWYIDLSGEAPRTEITEEEGLTDEFKEDAHIRFDKFKGRVEACFVIS